jgi:tRNA pseudouridine(38-40) synthase
LEVKGSRELIGICLFLCNRRLLLLTRLIAWRKERKSIRKMAEEGEILPQSVVENENDNDMEGVGGAGGGTRKRKRVILFGYSGAGFKGLQSQQGGMFHLNHEDEPGDDVQGDVPDTIEDVLHKALVQAGSISLANAESLQKISWSRSARTDRGVHAASQVVAAKLEIPNAEELVERGGDVSRRDEDLFVEKINSFLPNEQIRVYRIFRVNNNFNARTATMSRTYGYFLPEFALIGGGSEGSQTKSSYQMFDLRQALHCFVGSHCFHNFTEKLAPKDPRCRRVIESFTCGEPFVCNGRKVIRIQVKGQSFLKHHIRKMIGFVVECLRRGFASEVKELIARALDMENVVRDGGIPMAPAEALFLDVASFDYYNSSISSKGSKAFAPKLKQPSSSSSTAASSSTNLALETPAATESTQQQQHREPIDFVNDASVRRAREKLIEEIILPAVFAPGPDGAFEAFERWIEQRNSLEFPPLFVKANTPPQLQDCYEFLRIVEKNRAKKQKLDEWMR